jgi:hypothetical protein
MGQLRSTSFVGADSLRLLAWPSRLLMVGDIGCLGDIRVSVEKYLRVLTPGASPADILDGDYDIVVQTYIYAYHASINGHGTVLRYDNNHGRAGHADWHHVHRCDWRSADEVGAVEWVGEARWPTLGDVIRELAVWYDVHRDELPVPDAYATRILYHPT